MKITLLGYMGAGKTALGQALAQEWQLPFIDLDQRIEASTGDTIAQTMRNKGELFFRQIERKHLQQVLQEEAFVLATGGGTPCYYNNIEDINKHSHSVYLNLSVSTLAERLEADPAERPLLAHLSGAHLKEFIAKHLFERSVFYEQAAHHLKPHCQTIEDRLKAINTLLL